MSVNNESSNDKFIIEVIYNENGYLFQDIIEKLFIQKIKMGSYSKEKRK